MGPIQRRIPLERARRVCEKGPAVRQMGTMKIKREREREREIMLFIGKPIVVAISSKCIL